MKKKIDAERAILAIAMREGKSAEYIRTQIKLAMLSGLSDEDPRVQARWREIPCKGDTPTPEELIEYIAANAGAGINPFGRKFCVFALLNKRHCFICNCKPSSRVLS